MKTKKHRYKRKGGWEIAINPKDLRIHGHCRILEKQSTSGFEEVPYIQYPNKYALTNNLIQFDQNWCVEFRWKVSGALACLLDCGYWKAKVYFEWMGGGETSFSPETITQDLGRPGQKYKSRINIPAGKLKPGIYQVFCCLQYCFKDGSPGPISGFEEKGYLKIYQDKKYQHSRSTANGQPSEAVIVTQQ